MFWNECLSWTVSKFIKLKADTTTYLLLYFFIIRCTFSRISHPSQTSLLQSTSTMSTSKIKARIVDFRNNTTSSVYRIQYNRRVQVSCQHLRNCTENQEPEKYHFTFLNGLRNIIQSFLENLISISCALHKIYQMFDFAFSSSSRNGKSSVQKILSNNNRKDRLYSQDYQGRC